ncbi:MAG: GTPase HflX [Deltaproteobacteria bacterium HGW-Deltaproteobacteria-2]|nr:MAG: GTPase HflX [Deltaproteobacteria bacterium HGW-Deltaproteobacteria-2]
MNKIYGNTTGLRAAQIKQIERLGHKGIPPENIITNDLARQLSSISREINRQIGLLISRKGEISSVIVGDHKSILIPNLDGFRSSSLRFKGLRLIHTHLNGEELSDEDLTDLSHLRLDLIGALEVKQEGSPGVIHWAHLIAENPDGDYWLIMKPEEPHRLQINFLSFIQALEDEFARKQKARKIDAVEKAILLRVEKNPLAGAETSLAELAQLARTCGVEVFDSIVQYRPQPDPKFMVGRGKLSAIDLRASQIGANMLIFDHELTPAQARSISNFTGLKIIDRTQVILDIFARRAHSREGKIQVELAQLRYRLPRLTHVDTSLSRLAGGIGGIGPGETKLEIDRRRIRERIHRLEKDLKAITKSRRQRSSRREKTGLPIISIVGYTNAGKSTLLNTLTQSSVLVEDKLFATLDTKSARLRFPQDTEAIITDTVGFIRSLPEELFTAFRATLDELLDADILLHVIDASSSQFEEQIAAVEKILEDLEINGKPTIRVLNKSDRVADKEMLQNLCRRLDAVAVSALDKRTLFVLMEKIESQLSVNHPFSAR